jgi:hypothetical protein
MTRAPQLNARRMAGLGVIALLALPGAAQAADYRGQLAESISTGVAGVSPSLTLRATIDNGIGGKPDSTGSMSFSVDARHLAPTAWKSLMDAKPGTQLGTVKSDLTGSDARALRVLSHGHDATGPFVRAGVTVSAETAAIIGTDTLPVVIRQVPATKQVTFTFSLRAAVGKLTAHGATMTVQHMTLALRGSVTFSGKGHALTLNPAKDTAMTNSVIVRACGGPPCTTLSSATSTSKVTVHLPKTVTLAAPGNALYGYRYSIGGTGRPGDRVTLQALSNNNLVPSRGIAEVRPDGSFVIRATLRSAFADNGDLTLGARGRYAVASIEGKATVYGIATEDTKVSLAQPSFVLQRKAGGKLHFAIRVPGGDRHVRVAIKLGNETLANGFANQSGRFFKTIVKPSKTGNLRVVASVPGADTAISAATPLSQ